MVFAATFPSARAFAATSLKLPGETPDRHGRGGALRRRPARGDLARRMAFELNVIAAQQQRRDGRAFLRAGEGDMAVGVGGDLAVPAGALYAPVIVEFHATRGLRRRGSRELFQRPERRQIEPQRALESPIADRALLRLIGGRSRQRQQRGGRQTQARRLGRGRQRQQQHQGFKDHRSSLVARKL